MFSRYLVASLALAASYASASVDLRKPGDPGMPCLHGVTGTCGKPGNCTTSLQPGHCTGDYTNQCCVKIVKKYEAIRLDRPTSDFDDTPDDLTYCAHLDFCSHHGKCNVDLKECVCEGDWLGERCERFVHYNTTAGPVTTTVIEGQNGTEKMRGNVLFLGKAHHRLRQIMALIKILPNETKLQVERERLIDRLGMRHLLIGHSAHEKITEDKALWAAAHATNETLPVILTARLKDVAPTDKQITDVVNDAMKKALEQAIKESETGKGGTPIEKPKNPILTPDLTILDKKKMAGLGVRKQDVNSGTPTIGITKGKILRDRSSEGHLEEGHVGNEVDDMLSINQRMEHQDDVPGFDIQYLRPKEKVVKKEPETKIADDYNKEISAQFTRQTQGNSIQRQGGEVGSNELTGGKMQGANPALEFGKEMERRHRDQTHKIDDWNQYPNSRKDKVQNDYLNKELPKNQWATKMDMRNDKRDEFDMPHPEFKDIEPK
jgi:hypothetical protein